MKYIIDNIKIKDYERNIMTKGWEEYSENYYGELIRLLNILKLNNWKYSSISKFEKNFLAYMIHLDEKNEITIGNEWIEEIVKLGIGDISINEFCKIFFSDIMIQFVLQQSNINNWTIKETYDLIENQKNLLSLFLMKYWEYQYKNYIARIF